MVTEQDKKRDSAKRTAEDLSQRYPDRIFRVYSTPSGNYWVRGDKDVLTTIDGINVVIIDSYKNGQSLG